MISPSRAQEILASEGVVMSDEEAARLVDDLYSVGRVIVSAYRSSGDSGLPDPLRKEGRVTPEAKQ